MKTPEEIKKGLECCEIVTCPDKKCPYYASHIPCDVQVQKDALALIQQLEAQVPKWISVESAVPAPFVSVLGYMIDAGDFPPVRECYSIGHEFYFPALSETHAISHWMEIPQFTGESQKPTEEERKAAEPPKEEEK